MTVSSLLRRERGRFRMRFARHFKRSPENMVFGPSMRGLGLLMLGIVITSPLAKAQEQRPLYLVPVPASVQIGAGQLIIDSKFSVVSTGYTEPRLDRAVERFLRR